MASRREYTAQKKKTFANIEALWRLQNCKIIDCLSVSNPPSHVRNDFYHLHILPLRHPAACPNVTSGITCRKAYLTGAGILPLGHRDPILPGNRWGILPKIQKFCPDWHQALPTIAQGPHKTHQCSEGSIYSNIFIILAILFEALS